MPFDQRYVAPAVLEFATRGILVVVHVIAPVVGVTLTLGSIEFEDINVLCAF
jgi:hypothetical protein